MLHHGTHLSFPFELHVCICAEDSLQEVLQVELKGGSREGQVEVLENGGVHDTEAADLHGLLTGELQEDGGGVSGQVRRVWKYYVS